MCKSPVFLLGKLTIVLQQDTCFIQNQCFLNQATSEQNPCDMCDPAKSTGSWTRGNPYFHTIRNTTGSEYSVQKNEAEFIFLGLYYKRLTYCVIETYTVESAMS